MRQDAKILTGDFADALTLPTTVSLPELIAQLEAPDHVSFGYWRMRRAVDVALALAVILFGLPLICFIGLAIKLDSKGPVLFRQPRIGQRLRLFQIFKFRTMHEGVSSVPVAVFDPATKQYRRPKSQEDDRVTKVGKILRRFSLDELPQVLNVLAGQMSFIGPRPLALAESMAVPVEALNRYSVPAGISGLAQVNDRYVIISPSRFAHDVEYVRTIGWRTDLKIFLKTFRKMYDRG